MTAYAGLAAGILASDWTRAKVDMKHTGSMPANEEEEEARGEDSSDGERLQPPCSPQAAEALKGSGAGLGKVLKSDC